MKKSLIYQGKSFLTEVAPEFQKQAVDSLKAKIQITNKDSEQTGNVQINSLEFLPDHRFRIKLDNRSIEGIYYFSERSLFLHYEGKNFHIQEELPDSAGAGDRVYTSPMPGKVIQVAVQRGDSVAVGQTLVIVEAMKMENSIQARESGIVKDVLCEEGSFVEPEQVLVELED